MTTRRRTAAPVAVTPNLVKVAKLGEAVREFALADGANVGAAISAAGMEAGTFELRLNGVATDVSAVVQDGDIIVLSPKMKGGATRRRAATPCAAPTLIMVKIAKLGEAVREFAVEPGADVEDALETAGMEAGTFELRVNGAASEITTVLNDGDIIVLSPKMKGGK